MEIAIDAGEIGIDREEIAADIREMAKRSGEKAARALVIESCNAEIESDGALYPACKHRTAAPSRDMPGGRLTAPRRAVTLRPP